MLRYQLQQKRRMLSELKEELEYCRRKWALAREKNNESQLQWNDLRSEFSRRKLEDANNSGESGYSDEPVSDDDNSDDDSVKAKNLQAIKSELTSPSKKLLRQHSVSPIRSETSKKRDTSAPPISTLLTQVFQTASEIVPANLTLQASVVTKPVENLDLNYAARSSVVEPKTATKITIKNAACVGPSTSSGVRRKNVDEIRPRLSRELRKKTTKVNEKRKGEETLEEMFFRLSGEEPPQPEALESNEQDDEELYDEIEDIQETKPDATLILECNVSPLTPHLVSDESLNPEDISGIILSEEDEERRAQRAARFQRLEEQCQQLIAQVMKNSTRGDALNLHLDKVQRRFTPSRENSKSVDKSDAEGATGCLAITTETVTDNSECLTQREQEYTSRRAERLKRLEEECKEFLNKQNKSKIRANAISNKLDQLHQRYGSQERPETVSENSENKVVVLTAEEEAYTARRAERLKRLEEQSAELLERMAQSSSRANNIDSSLDALHNKFKEKESTESCTDSQLAVECCSVADEAIVVADEDIAENQFLHSDSIGGQNQSIEMLDSSIIVTENDNDDEGEEPVSVTDNNDN